MNRLPHGAVGRLAAGILLLFVAGFFGPLPAAIENDLPPQLVQLHNSGRYRELASALEKAVKEQPDSAPLHYWLGRSYYELHDYDRAAESLERATKLAPSRSEYQDWYGKACGRRAQEANPFVAFTLARKTFGAFKRAVQLAPTNIEAQRDLIRYLLNAPSFLGGGEDASLKQIRELSIVDAVDGMLARAEYYATKKKYDLAAAEYEKALQTDVRRVGVYMEIAEFYRDRGDGQRMSLAVEAAAKVAPNDPRLDYYRGVANVLSKQNLDHAEILLKDYLKFVPDGSQVPAHSSAHEWLGRLYEEQGKTDLAIAEYQSSLNLNPRGNEARKRLDRLTKH